MKYFDGTQIELGDRVVWQTSSFVESGLVVCLINQGKYIDDYDFTILQNQGGGIMILFDQLGLVQIFEDDEVELRFISRSP